MLGQILIVALASQAVLGAPSGCTEYCDESQPVLGSSHNNAKSSYSSFSKSSYGSRYSSASGPSAVVGLGATGAHLESLDDNVIGGQPGFKQPGSWRDEKHYITDDGRGQMSYRAGQTVSDNGYSKFAEHSYSYGSHDSHAPLANSQILSTSNFNSEFQKLQSRIANFMGTYALGSSGIVDFSTLSAFKHGASSISSQLNDVCNTVTAGSSMYNQMQQIMRQFEHDVETRQRELEAAVYSKGSQTHLGPSTAHYPIVQTSPAEVETIYQQQQEFEKQVQLKQQQQQQQQLLLQQQQQQQQQQQIENQISKIQGQISTFYTTFNRPDTSVQYQQELTTQVEIIRQQLTNLVLEAYQTESERQRIAQIKSQFEAYVQQITLHIQELEKRNRAEEARHRERELKLQLEKQQREERLRAEQEAQNLRLRQEEEERARLLAQQQELALKQARLQAEQQVPHQVTSSVHMSSSYEHNIKGSYGGHVEGGGSASSGYGHESERYTRPLQTLQPHVDMTAAMSRLQQDLNRLQTQVNNFNLYTMRLTATNTASVVNEAEREANNLRQNLENLCESSNAYQNESILSSAESLRRRFEEMFRSFQSQAANYTSGASYRRSGGYSASMSYGASGHYSSAKVPHISNVEYEHSKATDVELVKRPASQRYASTECVESYAGQPCVSNPTRYRRAAAAGGK